MSESGGIILSEREDEGSPFIYTFLLSSGHHCAATTNNLLGDQGDGAEPERPFQCCLQMQSSQMMTVLKSVFGGSCHVGILHGDGKYFELSRPL